MKKKITVYRIIRDIQYKKLIPVDQAAFDRERTKSWAFDGELPRTKWVELEMRSSDDSLESPDIWEIVPGTFAMEKKAYYELSASTEETQQGNMRFLKCEKRRLAVINSTHIVDFLDVDKSRFDKANASKIIKYSFDGAQLAISLFKIPQTRTTELLTLDGFDDGNDFKTLVERFSFTGVRFERLWTGYSFMDT
jgi:hypothetical protein